MPLTSALISARLPGALRRALLAAALPLCLWGAQATAQSVLPGSAAKLSSVVTTTEVRAELLALNTPGPDELHRAALAANRVALAYGQLIERLRMEAAVPRAQIC